MTDISSTTAKPDIPSMISPEDLAKKLVLEKRETWFPRAKVGDYLGDCQLMIADISLAIRAAVEAGRAIAARQTRPACGRVHECPRGLDTMARKPTIHELEALLEEKEDTPIEILPNGEIRVRGGSDANAFKSVVPQPCPACGRIHECPRGFSSEPAPENAAESIRARGKE